MATRGGKSKEKNGATIGFEAKLWTPPSSSSRRHAVIAATKDLEKVVQQRTFCHDLFYRLKAFSIRVPTFQLWVYSGVSSHPGNVTALLELARQGDRQATTALIEIVYPELRRIAASYLRRERSGHTLQPTALVHEAYLRLAGQSADLQNRAHFFGVAARLMRQILVEYARSRKALKRQADKVPIDGDLPANTPDSEDLIALDQALQKLATIDERQSRIVELRYFGGLTIAEIASLQGISEKTVKRDWTLARAWLHREISTSS